MAKSRRFGKMRGRDYTGNVYDMEGRPVESSRGLGGLPDNARRFESSLLILSGKFVDPDGIVYDADGTINEPATAAYAREVAAGRVAAPYDFAPTAADQKADSVRQRSEADASNMYWDSMFDNVATTAAELPARVADAAKGAFSVGKWVVGGLLAIAAIELLQHMPKPASYKKNPRRRRRIRRLR